ncbi:internalin [Hexamita inflata]|uniref:Internalin n=1 Tax=Hexamita inflata TaxID=28002 RepID=A0ABP1GDU0_9EUKA
METIQLHNSEHPTNIQNNCQILNTKQHLSDYDVRMIDLFQSYIVDGVLEISSNSEITDLNFVQYLNLRRLTLYSCQNINFQLSSSSIKELSANECRVHAIQNIHIEGLEILSLRNNVFTSEWIQNIICIFPQLKHLDLSENEVELCYISDFTQLTRLHLNNVKACNILELQNLIFLLELDLSENQLVDISPLRNLIQLRELNLQHNAIIDIHVIQNLVNLKQLNLQSNSIIFIDSLQNLLFDYLNLRFNKIIDFSVIQNHSNYDNYELENQKQRTDFELKRGQKMMAVNRPIEYLKTIRFKRRNFLLKVQTLKTGIQSLKILNEQNEVKILERFSAFLEISNVQELQ